MQRKMYIVCEGQSENAFVRKLLYPYIAGLVGWDIQLFPYTVITSFNKKNGLVHRGGISEYSKLKNDVIRCLKNGCPVTTMVDYYGIPSDFPGVAEAKKMSSSLSAIKKLEDSFEKDIDNRLFFPYLQLHEFEALFFTDLSKIKSFYLSDKEQNNIDNLMKTVDGLEPEEVNCGYETAPSKRLERTVSYQKGEIVTTPLQEIGIEKMRERCPHFNQWVDYVISCFS